MALTRSALISLVKDELEPGWRKEKERLDRIDRWYRWSPEEVLLPPSATRELRELRDLSRVPWLGLVVTSVAQCLYVDGYRSELDQGAAQMPDGGPWRVWQANYMDCRQIALHRATLAYGYAFATVLPGDPVPVIRGVSPRKMFAVYDDLAEDDWPEFAMRIISCTDTDLRARVYDAENVYTVRVPATTVNGGPSVIVEKTEEHAAGVVPVVRYCNELDLDGRASGEIEPHIPLAARINKTAYDRMLVQHFNSWKVRYVTGMVEPETQEEANRKKLDLRVQDILIAEDPDTKFGTLDETTLDGFIRAHQADIESLAAVTQTPAHELTGTLINVSAEGLAMIRASQMQKVHEVQKSIGRSHVQALRLASSLVGDDAFAQDVTGRVTWQDTSIRSMAQAVDALGKAATMLGIPASALWGRIPGVEKQDVEEWKAQAREEDPIDRMQRELERQARGPAQPADAGLA